MALEIPLKMISMKLFTIHLLWLYLLQYPHQASCTKVIIDTDPGNDDAVALGIACAARGVDILAVTSVPGNADIKKTTTNALDILQVFGRDDIPVYRGASKAILNWQENNTSLRFGNDGLCDTFEINPKRDQLKGPNAIDAINMLASSLPGQITFVALGPLTNLALALRFNPSLSKQLKEVIIMGGAITDEQNPEFNFASDPIAAQIVMKELTCKKYLVPFEVSGKEYYTPMDIVREYYSTGTAKSIFMKAIMHGFEKIHGSLSVSFPDAVAVAIALDKSTVKKMSHAFVSVSVRPDKSAGTCVILDSNAKGDKNVYLVDEIDYMVYRNMFLNSVL